MPRRTFAAVARSMWSRISSSRSRSTSSRRASERNRREMIRSSRPSVTLHMLHIPRMLRMLRMLHLPESHDGRDCAGQAIPVVGLELELFAAGPRQRIELGPAIVFARAPFRDDPALLFELVQRRV